MAYVRLSSFVVSSLLTLALSQQDDPIKDFCRRWGHATAQIDSKLYIDGGMIASTPFQSNHTNPWLLFSDLNPSTVGAEMPAQYANLSKPGNIPSVSGGYTWADNTNKCFYQFGGEYPAGVSPTDFSMWTYDVPLNQWNSTDTAGDKTIQRVSFGAGTQVEERGLGFYFGGWLSNRTMVDWKGPPMATNGLIQFDMSTGDLKNISGPDDIGRAEGQLVYLPVSDSGVLIYFGGIEDTYRNGSFDAANMSTIHIYDMASSKWYTQTASGTAPPTRRQFCADVTWPDDQSSYNIYLYGGYGFGGTPAFDDVYILSLPSFTWIKAFPLGDGGSNPVVVGHGGCSANVINRTQMLVIGGWFPIYDKCDSPESQGQHNMVLGFNGEGAKLWDKFQPKIDDYVVPSPIVAAIGGGPTGGATKTTPATWGHPDLATYYTLKPSYAARSATRPLPSATGSLSPNQPKKTNIGAIAGAAVGGAVGLILLLCLILFCLRRHKNALKEKRKKEGDINNANPPIPPAELETTVPQEMAASEASKYVSIHNRVDAATVAQHQEHAQQYSHSASHNYGSPQPTQGPPSYGFVPPYTSPTEATFSHVSPSVGRSFSDDGITQNSPTTVWGTPVDYHSHGSNHEGHYSYPTPTTPRQPPGDLFHQQVPIYYSQVNSMATRSRHSRSNLTEDGEASDSSLAGGSEQLPVSIANTPAHFYTHAGSYISGGRSSGGRSPDGRRPVQGRFMEEDHV
ncbi:hypothetical protein COCVIDRAFT_30500 [Bipolaris victoriae FI3]|uniref:Uncharacterized protein n=1 Tax=Bipolaris victoriae (strain FI3) TaxID=930091 RepID=W7E927_BIPV3|nr:hypothetical protein COCVIDRAFT_30500 [Bipolaris victoriae FI3]